MTSDGEVGGNDKSVAERVTVAHKQQTTEDLAKILLCKELVGYRVTRFEAQ